MNPDGVSWWRFFATITLTCVTLFLEWVTPEHQNFAIIPLLLIIPIYNNKTRPMSLMIWGLIALLAYRTVFS